LAESWNGTAWTIQQTAVPSGSSAVVLQSVSCAGSDCLAVGWNGSTALAEFWNGTTWSLEAVALPKGTTSSYLYAASCTGAGTTCQVVGNYSSSTVYEGLLAESWNGTMWTLQKAPTRRGTIQASFGGVSCTSPDACTAVGYFKNSSAEEVALAEGWNGTGWKIESVPFLKVAVGQLLAGVACLSANSCVAGGLFDANNGNTGALGAVWNGTSWKARSLPLPTGAGYGALTSVSCAVTSCTATGQESKNGNNDLPMAEVWNGSRWALKSLAPPTGVSSTNMTGIACIGTSTCTAVGFTSARNGSTATLIEAES
jgi:hypothetical protein